MDEGIYQCATSTEPPAYSSHTISVVETPKHTGRMKESGPVTCSSSVMLSVLSLLYLNGSSFSLFSPSVQQPVLYSFIFVFLIHHLEL